MKNKFRGYFFVFVGYAYGGPSVPLFNKFFNGKTGVLNGSFKLNGVFKPNFDCVNVYLRKNFTGILINDSKAK